jgi:hypothetical protein
MLSHDAAQQGEGVCFLWTALAQDHVRAWHVLARSKCGKQRNVYEHQNFHAEKLTEHYWLDSEPFNAILVMSLAPASCSAQRDTESGSAVCLSSCSNVKMMVAQRRNKESLETKTIRAFPGSEVGLSEVDSHAPYGRRKAMPL